MAIMKWKDLLLIPNLLTLGRIFLVFPSLYFLHEKNIFISILFLFAVFLTDFLDGFLARRWNQISQLGSILDPVADKLVVLILFSYFFSIELVPIWYFVLILVRDFSQLSAVPILLFWKKITFQVKPKLIPKWGTALNFIILSLIIAQDLLDWNKINLFRDQFLLPLYIISGAIEVYILLTFLPRFYQIYNGKHDTFE
jgi:CDP-diacylglycerol--glycerol-3-phosphate 3-phosphatidyltransferase